MVRPVVVEGDLEVEAGMVVADAVDGEEVVSLFYLFILFIFFIYISTCKSQTFFRSLKNNYIIQ